MKFNIPKTLIKKAFDVVLIRNKYSKSKQPKIKHFEFLSDALKLKELVEHAYLITLALDVEGNVSGIESFNCLGFYREKEFLTHLEPFIPDDSFMEFCGEDGMRWWYSIKAYKVVRQDPKLVWE